MNIHQLHVKSLLKIQGRFVSKKTPEEGIRADDDEKSEKHDQMVQTTLI